MTWHTEKPPPSASPDLTRFVEALNEHAGFFASQTALRVARAPGRLDLLGGIADYSGSLVLQLPLSVATYVAAQPVDAPRITIRSLSVEPADADPEVSIPLAALVPAREPLTYPTVNALLASDPRRRWAAYVAGAFVVLQRECRASFAHGSRVLIHSDVPVGKGVSSSAALEVAAMRAICAAYGLALEARRAALLCQKVENLVVGAPCGVMDQMTAACGEEGRLLALLCQPAELRGTVRIPDDLEIWGIDSGIRHAVSGADYGSARCGAFMGYRIIAELAGLKVVRRGEGRMEIEDPCWRGYLANIEPSAWEERFRAHVPAKLSGGEFLDMYGGFTDTATCVEPTQMYAVRQPTAHPIYEHHRVRLFATLLQRSSIDEEALRLLGELMYQSHASYSACGLGSDGTDQLVEAVRRAGPAAGLYGAKITGGGSGGTVALLAQRGAERQVRRIAEQYQSHTGRRTTLFGGSSPGAFRCGTFRMVAM
ncbi:MAG: galactokinase [Phycisphaerae bacterium]